MLIDEKALTHWMDHFYGYGSWHARMWFIGYEEGGGDLPEEVAGKLNYFYSAHASAAHATLCDIRELYRHVILREAAGEGPFTNLYEHRFGAHAVQHGAWKNLIAFVHSYRNETVPDLLAYQKNLLASPSRQGEALIRLYPLPSPHNHAWYYGWLDLPPEFRFLKSRLSYEQHMYQRRMHSILANINAYKPEVVLMYGMNNINMLKESVQGVFPGVKFKMVKAIKQQIPQHHCADLGGSILLITTQLPTLRHNRIETGFDWLAFGKSIRKGGMV